VNPQTLVKIRPASFSERPLLESLFQLYIYDFSELEPPDSEAFEVNTEGRFEAYPHLDTYWSDEKRWPLVIQVHEKIVGFALVNTLSHQGGSVERNMAEFFILRKHRRRGVASEAVQQILRIHPGQWEVAVAERNVAAITFWERALTAASNVSELRAVKGDGKQWRGPIWCFQALPHSLTAVADHP
jgi:predicted acetyltransferase